MREAFSYMKGTGMYPEQEYPYVGKTGLCKYRENLVKIQGFSSVAQGVDPLIQLLNLQPVSVAIDSHSAGFLNYVGGIYDGGCGSDFDHSVAVIGYGTDDSSGKDYWIIKNSWGETWGENGFMRLLRDESVCPITVDASFPIM
ncbi:cysteine protease XCP1-like [Silene latifolia]|uniref:cysteine protease XCP1-like n=1 Tax=Silene latifolia TaxID=37657 RepID=UPI003D77C08F